MWLFESIPLANPVRNNIANSLSKYEVCGYYQMKKCIRGFVMHYRMAEIKEEKAEMDYLKHKQKASSNNKTGNLCRTLF